MTPRPPGSAIPYRTEGQGSPNSRLWDPDLIPCQRPPFGFLTAIDLDNGTFRWRSVLGVVDKLIERGLPPTGAPNIGGSLATAGGLVFIGATNDSRFRAFDKDTGKELWVTKLPASAHASPMTFRSPKSGRQFVVIAAGGGNKYNTVYSDSLVAFALPKGAGGAPLVSYSKAAAREATATPRVQAAPSGPELFSHQRHAALKMACADCHRSVATGDRAAFPAASTCMSCHRSVAVDKPGIRRIAAMPATEKIAPRTAVYRLPDFVFFQHGRHATNGIDCATCHGDVWTQERIQPVLEMKMKACVSCHQSRHATVVCTACHELSQ
jgi:hypothetical protein